MVAQPAAAQTESPPQVAAGEALDREIDQFVAAHPGSSRVSEYVVAWDGGAVTLTWPNPATGRADSLVTMNAMSGDMSAMDVEGCQSGPFTSDYYCFYQYSNWGGRKLSFKDCGYTQYFADYGFRNEASSWVNTTNNTVRVYDYASGADILLWREEPDAKSSYVGSGANDRADYFRPACP